MKKSLYRQRINFAARSQCVSKKLEQATPELREGQVRILNPLEDDPYLELSLRHNEIVRDFEEAVASHESFKRKMAEGSAPEDSSDPLCKLGISPRIYDKK